MLIFGIFIMTDLHRIRIKLHGGIVTIVAFVDTAIMDALQIKEIGDELSDLIAEKGTKNMLLDFTNVKFLSSQMLGVMLSVHKTIIGRKGWFGVCGLKADLHKVFELTKLDSIFNFYDNEEKAITALAHKKL